MEKNCCWVNSKCVIIQNKTVILEIKFKVISDLSNYATKKELGHPTDVDTSGLAAKKILLLWKLKLTNRHC